MAERWVEPMRQKVRSAAIAATVDEAERIMEDARNRTPVDTSALKSTGRVRRDGATVRMLFGGRAFNGKIVRYAVYVHEMTWIPHRIGEAKFLENAINVARAGMERRLADGVSQRLGDQPFRSTSRLKRM